MSVIFVNATGGDTIKDLFNDINLLDVEMDSKDLFPIETDIRTWSNIDSVRLLASKVCECVRQNRSIRDYSVVLLVDMCGLQEYSRLLPDNGAVCPLLDDLETGNYDALKYLLVRMIAGPFSKTLAENDMLPTRRITLILSIRHKKESRVPQVDLNNVNILLGGEKALYNTFFELIGKNAEDTGIIHGDNVKALYLSNKPVVWEEAEMNKRRFVDKLDEVFTEDQKLVTVQTILSDPNNDTKKSVQLQLLLSSCIRNNMQLAFSVDKIDWSKLLDVLKKKSSIYNKLYNKYKTNQNLYTLGLIPQMFKLDAELYGLNDDGSAHTYFKTNVENGELEMHRADTSERISGLRNQQSAVNGIAFDERLEKKTDFDMLAKKAEALSNYYFLFSQKLKNDISQRLGDYFGDPTKDIGTPVLPKRKVATVWDTQETLTGEKHYARREKDLRSPREISGVARKAFHSVTTQYIEFERSRTLLLQSITEDCERFIKKVGRTKAIIGSIGKIVPWICVSLLILMLPYLIIQWKYLVMSPDSIPVFVSLFAGLPLGALLVACLSIRQIEFLRLKREWQKLIKHHHELSQDNEKAIKEYYKLLDYYVPKLREIYEYYLDSEYCAETAELAGAKFSHHLEKLQSRIAKLAMIRRRLAPGRKLDIFDVRDEELPEINFSRPYCDSSDGCNNRDIYSVFDDSVLQNEELNGNNGQEGGE